MWGQPPSAVRPSECSTVTPPPAPPFRPYPLLAHKVKYLDGPSLRLLPSAHTNPNCPALPKSEEAITSVRFSACLFLPGYWIRPTTATRPVTPNACCVVADRNWDGACHVSRNVSRTPVSRT